MKPVVALVVLIASLLAAPLASAETYVPPGNSAVTQYTQEFPTAGGGTKAGTGGKGKTPKQALGNENAQKLESKGPVGEEVATLAAETAPVDATPAHPAGKPHHAKNQGKSGNGQGNQNTGSGGNSNSGSGSGTGSTESAAAQAGSGSSGFGEILSQATGSSSGELGWFLPLLLIGTVLWSLYYFRRERRQAH